MYFANAAELAHVLEMHDVKILLIVRPYLMVHKYCVCEHIFDARSTVPDTIYADFLIHLGLENTIVALWLLSKSSFVLEVAVLTPPMFSQPGIKKDDFPIIRSRCLPAPRSTQNVCDS